MQISDIKSAGMYATVLLLKRYAKAMDLIRSGVL